MPLGRKTAAAAAAVAVLALVLLAGHVSRASTVIHLDGLPPNPAWARVLTGERRYKDGRQLWNVNDRLFDDEHYLIPGNLGGGLTNQVLSTINGIHVAITTGRTPILPVFTPHPSHLGTTKHSPPLRDLPFSEMFDLPRMVESLQMTRFGQDLRGAIDIEELIKMDMRQEKMWKLDCWCAWRLGAPTLGLMHIDTGCTYLPSEVQSAPNRVSLQGIVKYLAVDANRAMITNAIQPNETLPSHRVACLDTAFYMVNDAGPQTPSKHPSEDEAELVTADDGPWRTVGQYMHFAPDLVQKADAVRREIFGREEGEHVPSYIAVHIRHGDFVTRCNKQKTDKTKDKECYTQEPFAAAVVGIQADLLARKGLNVTDILIASDDRSAAFRAEAKERGWKMVDEELDLRIRERWGDWYPTLIDKVLLSGAVGFVGTKASTMSSRSAYRVQYWNDGPSKFVDRYA